MGQMKIKIRVRALPTKPRSNANTHVVGNKAGIPRIAIGNERQKKKKGKFDW